MKRTPRMKLFSPKFRTWIGQWNVRTLYESGKVAQLAAEMRRYRLEILGVSEARWNQFGETELATGELFLYSGNCRQSSGFSTRTLSLPFCMAVWLGNLEIDEATDQEIADIYQQVSKEDPEYPLARGHFK